MRQVTLFEKVPHYKFLAKLVADGNTIEDMLLAFSSEFNLELTVEEFIVDYLTKIPFSILKEVSATPADIPIANRVWRLLQWQHLYTRFAQEGSWSDAAKCLQAAKMETDPLQLDEEVPPKLNPDEKKRLSDGYNKMVKMIKQVTNMGAKEENDS